MNTLPYKTSANHTINDPSNCTLNDIYNMIPIHYPVEKKSQFRDELIAIFKSDDKLIKFMQIINNPDNSAKLNSEALGFALFSGVYNQQLQMIEALFRFTQSHEINLSLEHVVSSLNLALQRNRFDIVQTIDSHTHAIEHSLSKIVVRKISENVGVKGFDQYDFFALYGKEVNVFGVSYQSYLYNLLDFACLDHNEKTINYLLDQPYTLSLSVVEHAFLYCAQRQLIKEIKVLAQHPVSGSLILSSTRVSNYVQNLNPTSHQRIEIETIISRASLSQAITPATTIATGSFKI